MKISLNKNEFAKLIVNCFENEDNGNCAQCALLGLCPSMVENRTTAFHMGEICEIKEDET